MKLEEIIGQLFILGFQGKDLNEHSPIIQDIKKRNLGGVILFDRLLANNKNHNNIESPAQVKGLCDFLQKHSQSPLLIAIDQEGGMVKRLKRKTGFPETESAYELGIHNDVIRTEIHAATTACTLGKLGINYNLSPVVDLNIYPDNPVIGKIQRSFSASPEHVVHHAVLWLAEHKKQNILTCLKHFPGHGNSQTDSHLGFTDISNSWKKSELIPFQKLINDKKSSPIDSIMLGHLYHKGFDSKYPASLSPVIVGSLLRNKLAFQGVIITDDLQMKAITDNYGLEESVCLALAAGVDMIIVGNNLEYKPDFLKQVIPAIQRAVKEKKIEEEHIYKAWKRVSRLKEKLDNTQHKL